ncbi:MAG: T9SS type A sorting domain-containing protein, partial [Bacteroidota bacterium]|nr:T9SS type A sorting domain-containing protein [Bacteroidota bacterium]
IFNWSAEDPVIDAQIGGILTNSVSSLPEGAYTVTAIRNLTDTLVVPFYLEAGNDLEITIIPTADSLVATATGGDAPYYFNWNDGLDYGTGTTRLRIGINTISVFDNAGCQYSTTFFYYPDSALTYPSNGSTNTINNFVFNGDLVNTYSLDVLESLMTIFPVPAEGNRVALKWSGPMDGASYTMVDALGREMLKGSLNTPSVVLDLESIQSGVYHIIVDLNGQQVSKVFLRQ